MDIIDVRNFVVYPTYQYFYAGFKIHSVATFIWGVLAFLVFFFYDILKFKP